MPTPVSLLNSVFVVTAHQRYQKIARNDILYVQAEGSWVDIITVDKRYRLATNIGQLEPQLGTVDFCRVSRKHIVNLNHISAMQGGQVFVGDVAILIGKHYREAFVSRLPILRTKVDVLK